MRLFFAVTLIGFGMCFAGCSEQGSASQVADAPLKIQISQMFITVKNDSGVPLTNVSVSIVPKGAMGQAIAYTKLLDRLENSGSREIMLSEFGSRDGTPFNLRTAKPKAVQVKGTDINGKTYESTVPWK